jgi:hypothetical protein
MDAALSVYRVLLICSVLVVSAGAADADQQLYDQGDPSAQEQYMLELINRARAHPADEGVTLSKSPDPRVHEECAYFGDSLGQVKRDFASYAAKPPLAFNAQLINLARKHSNYLIDTNVQSHYETVTADPYYTAPDPLSRFETVFPFVLLCDENIYTQVTTPDFGHAAFLIDWGVPALDHRIPLMGLTDGAGKVDEFNQIGIGLVASPTTTDQVGPMVVTEDFYLDTQAYLTGVVYQDSNHDGCYDPGEGLAGVTITPSSGAYYAVTSASGGYTIPIDPNATGTLTVTASGPGLAAPVTQTVTLTGYNVKADFTAAPPRPALIKMAAVSPSVISVTRSGNLGSILDVTWAAAGSAAAGVDFQAPNAIIEFPAWISTERITIKSLLPPGSAQKQLNLKIKKGQLNKGSGWATLMIGG